MLNYNYLQEIINGCIENDRKCQEILYKMYYTKFKNIIRNHIKDQGKLEEILNDGFLRIFKKIHTYENDGSFDGWMLKIIKHSMFDYIKKYQKHTAVCFAEIDTPEHKVTSDKLHFKKLIDSQKTSFSVFQFIPIHEVNKTILSIVLTSTLYFL